MFVHSLLDDLGLQTSSFRVYGHLARRANKNNEAWGSIENMATVCRLHPKTIRSSLRALETLRMIKSTPRAGDTSIYKLLPPSLWLRVKGVVGKRQSNTQVSTGGASPTKPILTNPSQTELVKGNPTEVNPEKGIQYPHSPPKGDLLNEQVLTSVSQEEQIYAAYPKQVGRPTALRAIRRVLTKFSSDFLLERTHLFSQTCNSPAEFIPNPSTWFNQERFNDDPSTWRRGVTTQHPKPTIVRPGKFACGPSKTGATP